MTEVPRDRHGKPWVIQPDTGKCKAYSRASKYAEVLTDSYALAEWKTHKTAIGLIENGWLFNKVANHIPAYKAGDKGSWDEMSKLLAIAQGLAGANEKREWGSKVHGFTEKLDLGQEFPWPEGPMGADLMAYQYHTEDLSWREVERFVVVDELQVAGSFDRQEMGGRIADLKTGRLDPKIAIQLALYANGQFYECTHDPVYELDEKTGEQVLSKKGCEADPEAHRRSPIKGVNRTVGIVIELPYQQGVCNFWDVDLAKGWGWATELVPQVKAFRKAKVFSEFNSSPPF